MRRMKGVLGPALAAFVAVASVPAFAQSNGKVRDLTGPGARTSTVAGTLAPAEIVREVQRAGFDPISGPVQHGRVYVLFALDPNDRSVRLTVDAGSGRVLWVTGTRYGSLGYYGYHASYGYRAWWRYEPPPMPPGEIPNMRPGWNNFGPVTRNSSVRPSPPLPRTRPPGVGRAVAKDGAHPYPPPQAGEGREGGEPTATPGRPNAAAAPPLPSAPPTMVPVAPLE